MAQQTLPRTKIKSDRDRAHISQLSRQTQKLCSKGLTALLMAATEKRWDGAAGAAEYVEPCTKGFSRTDPILVDDHPIGYPQLAAFVDSDENFLMCRRFGFLHSRVLLYRQDELSYLEKNLIDMDELDKQELPLALKSRKTDEQRDDIEEQYTRKHLINTIDQKLKEYGIFSPSSAFISGINLKNFQMTLCEESDPLFL